MVHALEELLPLFVHTPDFASLRIQLEHKLEQEYPNEVFNITDEFLSLALTEIREGEIRLADRVDAARREREASILKRPSSAESLITPAFKTGSVFDRPALRRLS
jgi:hypothetical protein